MKSESKEIVDRIAQFALVSQGRAAKHAFEAQSMLKYSATFLYPDFSLPAFFEYVADMCSQRGLMPKITNRIRINICKNPNNTYSEKAAGNYYDIEVI